MDTGEKLKVWARELKAIAQTGLEYGKDVYDKERYDQLNAIANDILAYISGSHIQEINKILPIESGYATPKIGVRALIESNGKILMVKETADGCWSLPGGWCDIGLAPSENIEKEVREETGLFVQAVRLLALFDQTKYCSSINLQHIYTAYFECRVTGGNLRGSIETSEVDFFHLDELPPLSKERMTHEQLMKALTIAKTKGSAVYFD